MMHSTAEVVGGCGFPRGPVAGLSASPVSVAIGRLAQDLAQRTSFFPSVDFLFNVAHFMTSLLHAFNNTKMFVCIKKSSSLLVVPLV